MLLRDTESMPRNNMLNSSVLFLFYAPGIQMFDYLKEGFSKFPADYFNRPFSRAAEDISGLWNSGHHGNYVNKSIICYFIIAIKLKGRHILQ
jgi:hypothetical protein